MTKKIAKILFLLVIIALTCAAPAAADLKTIDQGNVVFIGEEGLDITLALGPATQIGWWASAADISNSAPSKTIDLSTRKTNFMVSPSDFTGYTSGWYRLDSSGKSTGSAFTVADPQLAMTVEDTTTSVDFDRLHWIPTGDDIRFRIDTNLVQMISQRGASPLISIKVRSPDGAMYSSIYDAGGNPTPLAEIPVTTSPYYTNSIWNMGSADRYPPGTYTLWAECNVNKMMDNYGETGKTISSQFTLLNQGINPLIRTYTTQASVLPTTRMTTVIPTQATVTPQPTATSQVPPIVTTIPATPVPVITTSASTPAPTRTPGFEALGAGAALLIGLAICGKKE
jgi:trimeric autotransporter adhesin